MKLILIYISIFSFLLTSYTVSAQHIIVGQGENTEEITKISDQGFTLNIKVKQIQFIKVKHKRDLYYSAQIPNFSKTLEIGNPQLPSYKQLIEVPKNANYQIVVKKMHFVVYDLDQYNVKAPLFPSQESMEKRVDAPIRFDINKSTYSSDAFYSEPLHTIEYLGEMRGQHIARLSLSPVEYNPVKNQIKLYDELEIEVVFNQLVEGIPSEKTKSYAPAFQHINQYLLNSQKTNSALTPVLGAQYPLKYVIVSDSSFRSSLQPFIKWKEKQGYKIIEAYTSDTAVGNTNSSIKNYLQGLYYAGTALDPAPSYVLFVGDVTQIPKYPGIVSSWAADLYYCEFTNDYFPEMMYGRFSANDTSELIPQIEKTIEYEKYLMANPSYLDTSILISGSDASHATTYGDGQINYGTANYFNSINNIYCKSYLYVNQSYNKDLEIRQNADSGAAFINYTAHGKVSGWYDPQFYTSHVSNMTNKGKYPLMVGNACLTNKFDGPSTCFGEALLRAKNKGAIGYIGASENTLWDEDYYWAVGYGNISSNPTYTTTTSGLYDLIFHTHGEAYSQWAINSYHYIQAGNMAVTRGGSNVRRYWELYHLMGDPSLMPYLKVPSTISATYSPLIPIGVTDFTVNTEPYALVAISQNDSLISSNYADSLGVATLYFPVFTQSGTVDIVISASQKQPYFGSLNVGSPNGPYIIYNAHQIIDSSQNNNRQADYNETVGLDIDLLNITSHDADSAFANLRSSSTSITLIDSTYYLGNFPGYDTLSFNDAFTFKVSPNAKDGELVKFYIDAVDSSLTPWTSHFFVSLYAPDILIHNTIVDDSQFGNGNGRLEAGETVYMYIPLSNSGSLDANQIHCSFTTSYTGVSIANTSLLIDTLKVDSIRYTQFEVTLNSGFNTGDIVVFDFSYDTHNRIDHKLITQLIGFVDEDFETGDFSMFDWITSDQKNWFVQDTVVFEGNYSSCSGLLGNSDTSSLQITLKVLSSDSISFFRKVSTESSFDFMYFFIDDISQGKWSGNSGWHKETFKVSEGTHTFKWSYIKDYYNVENRDAVFLDMISFPPTDAWTNVENAQNDLNSIKLMPNPATDYCVLSFEIEKASKADILLFDHKGRLVRTLKSNYTLHGGHQEVGINTQNLSSGIYFVRILSSEGQWNKKLIIL